MLALIMKSVIKRKPPGIPRFSLLSEPTLSELTGLSSLTQVHTHTHTHHCLCLPCAKDIIYTIMHFILTIKQKFCKGATILLLSIRKMIK